MKYILPQKNEICFALRCEKSTVQFFQNKDYSDNEIFFEGKLYSPYNAEWIKYYDWLAEIKVHNVPHNFKFRINFKLDKEIPKNLDGKVTFHNFMGNKDTEDIAIDPGLEIEIKISSEKVFAELCSKANTTSKINISLFVYIPDLTSLMPTWDVEKHKELKVTRYFIYNNNKLTTNE